MATALHLIPLAFPTLDRDPKATLQQDQVTVVREETKRPGTRDAMPGALVEVTFHKKPR